MSFNDILEKSVKILRAALALDRQVKYDAWAEGKSVVEQYRKLSKHTSREEEPGLREALRKISNHVNSHRGVFAARGNEYYRPLVEIAEIAEAALAARTPPQKQGETP